MNLLPVTPVASVPSLIVANADPARRILLGLGSSTCAADTAWSRLHLEKRWKDGKPAAVTDREKQLSAIPQATNSDQEEQR